MQQEESARRHTTQLEEIRRKAMEMSTLRGPSAEDHYHMSPTPDDVKTTTSTTSILTTEDPIVASRKCCTLCNLLVCILIVYEGSFETVVLLFSWHLIYTYKRIFVVLVIANCYSNDIIKRMTMERKNNRLRKKL